MNDLLTQDEIYDLVGISKNTNNKIEKIRKVLDKAGIYYWLKINGEIGTTWHHVHNPNTLTQAANEPTTSTLPDFDKIA